MLPHERQRIGQQIECDRQPPARLAHHGLVVFERVSMLVEYRHKFQSTVHSRQFTAITSAALTDAVPRGLEGIVDRAAAGSERLLPRRPPKSSSRRCGF